MVYTRNVGFKVDMDIPLHLRLIATDWHSTGIRVKVRDPVDNCSVLRNSSRDLLFEWCAQNCRGKFWIGMGFGKFELDEDAVLFKLTWT